MRAVCAGRVGNTTLLESRVAQSGSSSRSGAFFRTVFSSGALFVHAGAPRRFQFFSLLSFRRFPLHFSSLHFCIAPSTVTSPCTPVVVRARQVLFDFLKKLVVTSLKFSRPEITERARDTRYGSTVVVTAVYGPLPDRFVCLSSIRLFYWNNIVFINRLFTVFLSAADATTATAPRSTVTFPARYRPTGIADFSNSIIFAKTVDYCFGRCRSICRRRRRVAAVAIPRRRCEIGNIFFSNLNRFPPLSRRQYW